MNKQELIKKYKRLEGVWDAEGAEIARRIFLLDLYQLDEPEKVTIPQSVVDWIEHFKKCSGTLYGSTAPYSYYGRAITDGFEGDVIEVLRWIRDNSEVYARAWLDGYEVEKEKEKRYVVKIIGITNYNSYLNYHKGENKWTIESRVEIDAIRTKHTRKELEDAGFGEVFNSPLFEVEEVE